MRILVVEDEIKIAHFLKKSLEAEYFAVDIARTGTDGSHMAQINEYDLIILDYMLPEKNGLEVLKEIRANAVQAPVLMLSIKNDVLNKVDVLNAGADDYLTKPFVLEELLARIHALLRRPKRVEHEILTVGDVTIHTKTFAVMRGKKDIQLTRKEFMLLQYLMQHEGSVLTRGMILEHVWDMDTDIFSNTIESHMLSLRKKLGDMGKKRLIQTIPSRGYKMGGF